MVIEIDLRNVLNILNIVLHVCTATHMPKPFSASYYGGVSLDCPVSNDWAHISVPDLHVKKALFELLDVFSWLSHKSVHDAAKTNR
jgi:hypothetical protein